jgi:hypothetical protein
MTFLARNEYLLGEIDYYHGQICARLTADRWSENYRRIWNAVCFQLGWEGYGEVAGPGERMVRNLLRRTGYGRQWPMDSPVLSGSVGLSRADSIACRTLFGFDLITDGWGDWEPLACGVAAAGETLVVLRLLPYLEYMLDVGAGKGYFAFLAAQNGVAVTALEPSPPEYRQLRTGIAVNGFANIAAPVCSVDWQAEGGAFYLEGEHTPDPLTLGEFRIAGALIRLALPAFAPALLQDAADWLTAYDAPVLLITAEMEQDGGRAGGMTQAVQLLARYDYNLFTVVRQPEHGVAPLSPLAGGGRRPAECFLALPPMAKDLAEPLTKPVDMRVFTLTAKLENLYYFVKMSFDGL